MSGFQRRTRLFMSWKFQVRYVGLIILFMIISAAVTGYTIYLTTWTMLGEKLAAVYPQGLLSDIVRKVNMVLGTRLIFLFPAVIFIAMVLSHRIAGPIYRIKKYLENVSDGNYEDYLNLREKDELRDIAGSLDKLVSRLRSERNSRLEKIDILKSETDELRQALNAEIPDRSKLLAKITEIHRMVNESGLMD